MPADISPWRYLSIGDLAFGDGIGERRCMTVLVTGAAGFIGYHLATRLLADGHQVVGFDNFNAYYDVKLKESRAERLSRQNGFTLVRGDLENQEDIDQTFSETPFTHVVHLAAQVGVRYSAKNPRAYVGGNIVGFMNLLEACRAQPPIHVVFASTSSVYGASTARPYKESAAIAHPLSLYAATKQANEGIAHTYAHVFGLAMTGLRFFTVYGPWGRPDMAAYRFVSRILRNEPIDVYNNGDMERDFTYVDDVVEGVVRVMKDIPKPASAWDGSHPDHGASGTAPFRILNVGRGEPVNLMDFITTIELALGIKAKTNLVPMQPGDMSRTWCDTSSMETAVDYRPQVHLTEGIQNYVAWFKDYYGTNP